MIIIIEQAKLQFARNMLKDICMRYGEKIEKPLKHRYEILFKNGDCIKFISAQSNCNDGLRADVAIGEKADCLTFASNQKKRIWDYNDLDYYLKNL